MSFVDIAYLKRENIVKGEIRYCRRKTGQLIRIRIEPCIQNIIDKYSNDMSLDYVFPILEKRLKSVKYNTSLKNLNNSLLKISELLSLDPPVTTYVARHTWATMARRGGVPVSTISECMGHTSEKTTQIYLSSIEQKSIDDANRLVIHSLNQR
jgi:integrase